MRLLGHQTQMARAGMSISNINDVAGNRIQRTDYNTVTMNYSYENLNRLTTSLTPMHDHLLLRSTEYLTRQRMKTELYISYDNRYRVGTFSYPCFQR
jgi:hypothetical protein